MIRKAKLSDLPRIMTIEFLCFDHPENEDVLGSGIEHQMVDVVEEQGSVSAYAEWGSINELDPTYPVKAADLYSIAVHPSQRRKGHGRSLVEYLQAKNDSIYAICRETNLDGQKFLSSCGIRAVAVLDNYHVAHSESAYAFEWHREPKEICDGKKHEGKRHVRSDVG